MTISPWLWLIAGPNGAGKSTFAPTLSSVVDEIVRPDELAVNLSSDNPESVALEAGRKAIARIWSLLEQRRPFAIETTLAGRMHLRVAESAIKQGWSVGIIYIGLRSPELAIERVHLRHLRGGHNVPSVDVRRRYDRSLKNFAAIYRVATRTVVLDNSSSRT